MIYEIAIGILLAIVLGSIAILFFANIAESFDAILAIIYSIGLITVFIFYFDTAVVIFGVFVIAVTLIISKVLISTLKGRLVNRQLVFQYILTKTIPTYTDNGKIGKIKKLNAIEKEGGVNRRKALDFAQVHILKAINNLESKLNNNLKEIGRQLNSFDIGTVEIDGEVFDNLFDSRMHKIELNMIRVGPTIISIETSNAYKGSGIIARIEIMAEPKNFKKCNIHYNFTCEEGRDYDKEYNLNTVIKKSKKCILKYIKNHPDVLASD